MANTMANSPQVSLSSSLSSTPSALDQSKRWVVGAAIVLSHPSSSSSSSPATIPNPVRLLLLRRSPTETAYPHHWELPGGHVEPTDATLKAAVIREVKEETGLAIRRFLVRLGDMVWMGKRVENVQVNYLVSATSHHQHSEHGRDGEDQGDRRDGEEQQVTLNPEEHSSYMWAEEGDVEELYMTGEMKKVVRDAFRAAREMSDSPDSFVTLERSVGVE